jgi:hypothetical protein
MTILHVTTFEGSKAPVKNSGGNMGKNNVVVWGQVKVIG